MMIRNASVLALGLLAACETPPQGDVTRDDPTATGTAPVARKAADGTCHAREIIPAVYEQVPGQVQVVQAQYDDQGNVIQPPIYRNATVPRLVKPRGEFRFETPCPSQMTTEFIASLQRALYARGYLKGAITGRIDAATRAAIGAYQRDHGLKSDQLALATARDLGLVIVPLDRG